MSFDDLTDLFKNKGFQNTFQILSKFKNYRAERHKFYEESKKFSYYNSFYRIKDRLIENGLISVKKYKGKKYISLTKKGKQVYEKLIELNNIISV